MKLAKIAAVLVVTVACTANADQATLRTPAARELQIDIGDILDNLPDNIKDIINNLPTDLQEILNNLPQDVQDVLAQITAALDEDVLANLQQLLADGAAQVQALLEQLKDLIANNIPDNLVNEIVKAAETNTALSVEIQAQIEAYLPAGQTLPATLTIPGLADVVDQIKAAIPNAADVIANIEALLANANLPELDDILAAIKDALANGLDAATANKVVQAAKDGVTLDAATIAEVEAKLNGASLPKTLTIPGLQDLIGQLPGGLQDLLDGLLADVNIPDLDELIAALEGAVANNIPDNLLEDALATIKAGGKLSVEQMAALDVYLADDKPVPASLQEPAPVPDGGSPAGPTSPTPGTPAAPGDVNSPAPPNSASAMAQPALLALAAAAAVRAM